MRPALCLLACLAGCHAPPPPKAAAQPFCTRTLGVAQCFTDPDRLPDHPEPLADTPQRTPPLPDPWWKKVASHWQD